MVVDLSFSGMYYIDNFQLWMKYTLLLVLLRKKNILLW